MEGQVGLKAAVVVVVVVVQQSWLAVAAGKATSGAVVVEFAVGFAVEPVVEPVVELVAELVVEPVVEQSKLAAAVAGTTLLEPVAVEQPQIAVALVVVAAVGTAG